MKKKTVFITHPIRGDIRGNVRKILAILRKVHKRDFIPVAPYLGSLQYLNDEDDGERELGIEANLECFRRRYVDELWLFGDPISTGMGQEVRLAQKLSIPVIPQTQGTKRDFARLTRKSNPK